MKKEKNPIRMTKQKSFYCIVVVFIFFVGRLVAQPGGGGGLEIGNLYDGKLNKIDIHTDASLKIRNFVLDGEKVSMETFPASLSIPAVKYQRNTSNQRMYIVYKKETMIIDFIGIIPENGAGVRDGMDSLVFQKGYFKYNWSKRKKIDKSFNYDSKGTGNGLTIHKRKQLVSTGYLEYNPTINLSFLSRKHLPASYFINRAAYYLRNDQTKLAFKDIKRAIKKNNGVKNCEVAYLLCNAFTITKKYKKAIENISDAINNNCEKYVFIEDRISKIENLRTRIELFIKLKLYNKALEDFNSIYAISKSKRSPNSERANFKIKYLKDYQDAINDLKTTIDSIPIDHLSDRPQGTSEYCDTYFTLGNAEYLNGDKKTAFKHWLKAEEFGYTQTHDNNPIIHFDSIIFQNPKVPELYLARALAHYSKVRSSWQEDSKSLDDALSDINKAEELGMKEYRIDMFRARVFTQLKKYDEAMKEINIAISKNTSDPRNFLFRYYIRDKLGLVKWGDDNDVDYHQYKMLTKDWKWEKY